jgi:hypothetical protein
MLRETAKVEELVRRINMSEKQVAYGRAFIDREAVLPHQLNARSLG